jgi:hypothetical protein
LSVRPRRIGFLVVVLVFFSACAAAQGPAAAGVVADLAVSIASVEPCGKTTGAIVTLKVANRGKSFAEPLVFEVAPKEGAAVVLRRTPGPYVGRFGRPAPPGGQQTYPVFHTGAHASLAGAKARVLDASFFSVAPAAEASPVEIGQPRTDKKKHELGPTVEFAILPLRNLRDATVDVTIRVAFDRPLAESVLIFRRLKPREAVDATFTDLVYEPAQDLPWQPPDVSIDLVAPRGARIASAKLVDWCFVGSGAGADAARLLGDAYSRWLRWEGAPFGVSGAWIATVRPQSGAARASRGKFGVSDKGAVACDAAGALPEDAQKIKKAIEVAFGDLRRPPADEFVASCKPAMERTGPPAVIACNGASSGEYERTRFAIDGGRIIGHNWSGGAPTDLHVDWKLEPFEGGYVVAERSAFNIGGRGRPTEVHRWRYARVDGLLVPAKYSLSSDMAPVAESWSVEVVFHDVKRDATAGAPVASPATEAVRAAWESGYRYPESPISFTCRFTVKAGKDGVWRGVKEAKGRITFSGWRGHARSNNVVEVEGVADESLRSTLAFAVDDRIGLWHGRDFAARGSFDAVFAGASFVERPAAPGVFDVKNGPYGSVTVKDGRIAVLTFLDGTLRTLFWTKVADQHVVTRITTGPEDLTAAYVRVGPVLVPARMVYKGVFGDEKSWGVEEVVLSDLALK